MSVVPALPAATVTLVRDGAAGLEVLMLQRNFQSGFMPGMFLFPGGALDPCDGASEVLSRCCGLTDDVASAALGLREGGLAYWAAAIRESFEEAGVLLAYGEDGQLVNPSTGDHVARYEEYRSKLNAGEDVLTQMLQGERLRLAVDRLTYFSHWITPVTAPRRYDTRFFIAEAPQGQEALPDNVEAIHHVWVNPPSAVQKHREGQFKMRTPTVRTLEKFAEFESVESLLTALRAQTEIPAILPRIGAGGERLMPGDPGYEDIAAAGEQGKWKT